MYRMLGAALLALAFTGAPHAQPTIGDATDMQALRQAVKSDKRALVASTMRFNDAEARKFWPIYDAYQRSLDMASRERSVAAETLLSRDRAMSNLAAKSLATQTLTADEIEMKARRTMFNRLMRALPAVKVARYMQLESKIRATQAYDIAQAFPLVN